jgi:hypothetical protein
MTARPDDEALTWDGDDDPTLAVGSAAVADEVDSSDADTADEDAATTLPEGWNAVGKGSGAVAVESVPDDTAARRPHMGNGALIALGILGGFYLLFTIGWLIGGFRLQGSAQYLVADVMFQGSFWLAVLAPALWFGTVFLLTQRSAAWVRITWLIAGAILLVPWPFIMVGAVGR